MKFYVFDQSKFRNFDSKYGGLRIEIYNWFKLNNIEWKLVIPAAIFLNDEWVKLAGGKSMWIDILEIDFKNDDELMLFKLTWL